MEHLSIIGCRLLGKKCVAGFILGILGLCCPFSLSAEKLDTTFVLDIDMTIDTTPCYYVKYAQRGITDYGRYIPSDFFRINVGYVTNESGEIIDTLIYGCDRVTKQWRRTSFVVDEFYSNGMPKYKNYSVEYSYAHLWEMPDSLGNWKYPTDMTYFEYSSDGYYREDCKFYGISDPSGGTHFNYYQSYHGCYYDNYGNLSMRSDYDHLYIERHYPRVEWIYRNEYDSLHNLVSYVLKIDDESDISYEEKLVYTYDNYNRRIKSVRYVPVNPESEEIWEVHDSTVYSYGNPPFGHPFLITSSGVIIDGFSADKYEYDLSDSTLFNSIEVLGVKAKRTYDAESSVLTIHALDTVYTLTCKRPESYLSAILVNDEPLDSFSFDRFEYDCSKDYVCAEFSFKVSQGAILIKKYDEESSLLSVSVYGADNSYDSTNTHTYSIRCKKPESYLTALTASDSIISMFVPDSFEYDFSELYVCSEIGYVVKPGATVKRNYDCLSNTLTLTVYGADYKTNSDNVHTYTILCKKPESYLISASIDGVPIDGFSYDKFSYDQLDFIYEDIVFSFQTSIGATVECRHYTNNQNLTLLVKGYDNYCKTDDTIIKNEQEYVFMFKPNTRLNSLLWGRSEVDTFSPYKYVYDFSSYYLADFYGNDGLYLSTSADGSWPSINTVIWAANSSCNIGKSYDPSTGIATVRVVDRNDSENFHTYTFYTKKYDWALNHVSFEYCGKETSRGLLIKEGVYDYAVDGDYSSACNFTYKPFFFNMKEAHENGWVTEDYIDSLSTIVIVVTNPGYDTVTYHIKFVPNSNSDPVTKKRPYLDSILVDGLPLKTFRKDVFVYQLRDVEYHPGIVEAVSSDSKIHIEESFDDSTNILILTLHFDGDSLLKTAYKIQFRPSDGVSDVLGEHVSLYTVDKTICVDGAEEPVYVYDLMGVLLGTGKGDEVRIPMKMAGVYVVRVGGRAVKALVE